MNTAVIVFPGSNCDADVYHALQLMGHRVKYVWHKESELNAFELVVLPGGFSYGDYLRAGAIARFSPIMKEVVHHARRGKLVLGICNGFQILAEVGLLPGALLPNENLRFVCKHIYIRVENERTQFTRTLLDRKVLKIPIAHGEGNYFIDSDGLKALKDHNQIVFRYCDSEGRLVQEANPNGSVDNIAGIINRQGNVLGMMPHPERAVEITLGSEDGRAIFESLTS